MEKQLVPTQPRKWPQPLLSLFLQILPVTHTEISPEQVLEHSLQRLGSGSGSSSPNLGSTQGTGTGGTALRPQPGLRTEAESSGAKAGARACLGRVLVCGFRRPWSVPRSGCSGSSRRPSCLTSGPTADGLQGDATPGPSGRTGTRVVFVTEVSENGVLEQFLLTANLEYFCL